MDSLDLLVDSGCNGLMLKDIALFKDMDESFGDEVDNANGSPTAVERRGTARCWELDSKGELCELELKQALWVPNYTRNLISVEKLAQHCRGKLAGRKEVTWQGEEVTFGNDPRIKTFD